MYIGEQQTIKHIMLGEDGAPVSPTSAQYRVQSPEGIETALAGATVNGNEISFTYTPQHEGVFGFTIVDDTGRINTGYFMVIGKEGLTAQARAVMDQLQVSVSVEVDEYLEKATDVNDVAIPMGDIPFYLNEGAKEVVRRIDRTQALDITQRAKGIFAITDASKGRSLIPVPEDYYRFIDLKLSSFNQPVTEYVPQTSSAYRLQQFKQRRGTASRPFVSLIPHEGTYNAEVVPDGKVYATIETHPSKGEYVMKGDALTGAGGTGTVQSVDDPEFVIVDATTAFTKNGIALVTGKDYTLRMAFIAGDTVVRTSHGKALECYPNGAVEYLHYVPLLKAYDIEEQYHQAVIKFATYRVFLSMRQVDLAKLALEDFSLIIQSFNAGLRGEEGNE